MEHLSRVPGDGQRCLEKTRTASGLQYYGLWQSLLTAELRFLAAF